MGLKEPGLRGSLRNVSVGITALPDSDLTQYQITDPDDNLTVIDSESFDSRVPNSPNDESRLYQTFDDKFSLNWTFTFENITSSNESDSFIFGFATDADSTFTNLSNFVGLRYVDVSGEDDQGFETFTDDDSLGSPYDTFVQVDTGQSVTVSIDFDVESGDMTAEIIDSGTVIGTDSVTFDGSLNWIHHYPYIGGNGSFGDPGQHDVDINDHQFNSL